MALYYPGNSVSSSSEKDRDTYATSLRMLCKHLSGGSKANQFVDSKGHHSMVGKITTLGIAVI